MWTELDRSSHPHIKVEIFICYRFNIKSDGWYGSDNLANLLLHQRVVLTWSSRQYFESIQQSCLSRIILLNV